MSSAPLAINPVKTLGFKEALQTVAFFGAYLIFGLVGCVASVACLVPASFFHGVQAHRFGRRLIHRLFAFFVGYLRTCGLLELEANELSVLKNSRGLILIANHPCLLDAVF